MDDLAGYDYLLPPELIAQTPAAQREAARLLVLERASGRISHRSIRDLPELLRPDDCLIFNDTRVVPARLTGYRLATGGKWEGLFLKYQPPSRWLLIGKTRGRLRAGEQLAIPLLKPPLTSESALPAELKLTLDEPADDGAWWVTPEIPGPPWDLLDAYGSIPLPPYIAREAPDDSDAQRYQTLFARHPGSAAAPTAGLHFTADLLAACRARGVQDYYVTLHVGLGTFRPIAAESLSQHRMHSEWCAISAETARALREAKAAGRRLVAVGTTTVRTLETAAASGTLQEFAGETNIFIRPPYEFKAIDALLTNFHLPKSTLLVLLSALAGREQILSAYAGAVAERYRFYSYGDAMFVQ